MKTINIIGAGLAGSEIAYYLSKQGYKINLFEMRPNTNTPAHKTENFAELVCSNSFRSIDPFHPAGILKNELEKLNSFLIKKAKEFSIPGGNALTIDREKFSKNITETLHNIPNISISIEEVKNLNFDDLTVIATGPLTSENLANRLKEITGAENFYFYDAIAPIIDADTIDMEYAFYGNRYSDIDSKDYLNCFLTEEEYIKFVNELLNAKIFPYRDFEKGLHFEGCMPIEEMAKRGKMTLAFGPMKPVGLINPKTGKQAFAVVQLRRENKEGTAYNIVGFQTKMTIPEQERVFRLIPALKNAKFLRYGSLHRNIYINAPEVLNNDLSLKGHPNLFIAGQLSGVEGYIESIAQGFLVALIIDAKLNSKTFKYPPQETAIGALYNFLREKKKNFTPSNINFSLFKYGKNIKKIRNKKIKKKLIKEQAENFFNNWLKEIFNA